MKVKTDKDEVKRLEENVEWLTYCVYVSSPVAFASRALIPAMRHNIFL